MTHKKTSRNSSIELLRFFFMFSIVLIHVYVHGNHLNYEAIYDFGKNQDTALHLALFSFGMIGVTGFMFISGYYGIRMSKRKWINMLAMLLFYTVVMKLITGDISLGSFVYLLKPFELWWFISAYLFICLIAPFIEEAITRMNEKKNRYIVLGALYYTYVAHFVGMHNDRDVPFLLTIYLSARYLKNYPPPLFIKYLKPISIVCVLLLCFIPILISIMKLPSKLNELFISNNNILLLILSACLVIGLEKKKTHISIVNYFSSSVLAIYLITEFGKIREWLNPMLLSYVLDWYGLLLVVLICMVCVLVDKVREAIFRLVGIS